MKSEFAFYPVNGICGIVGPDDGLAENHIVLTLKFLAGFNRFVKRDGLETEIGQHLAHFAGRFARLHGLAHLHRDLRLRRVVGEVVAHILHTAELELLSAPARTRGV